MKKLFLFSVYIFFLLNISAQTAVNGKIFNEKTKEPLVFVNVFFKDKKIGTKSDSYGRFKLTSPKDESVVFFSSTEYEPKEITIKPGSTNTLAVYLAPKVKQKREVKIKLRRNKIPKDTIALRIFRNIIKNKENNKPKSFDTYQYLEYSKLEMDIANIDSSINNNVLLKPFRVLLENKDTTEDGEVYFPIYFKETITRGYLKGNPKKSKKIIEADKITELLPFESISDLLAYTFDEIDIYQNNIIIANRAFMSPIADGGLVLYRYYLEDSFAVDGKMNYRMFFTPKSKEDFGFTGKFVVEEGSWAIKEMNIGVDKRANINFVKRFDITQGYTFVSNQWVMNRDIRDVAMAFNKTSKKVFNVRFKQTSNRRDIIIDQPIPDTIFTGDAIEKNIGYNKKSDKFWEEARFDKLSKVEQNLYISVDSVKRTKAYKTFDYLLYVATSGFLPIHPINWEIGRVYQMVSWNNVEGVRLRFGARTTWQFSNKVNPSFYVAYGTKDKEFKYGADLLVNLARKPGKWHQFGIGTFYDYFKFGQSEDVLFYDNILNSVLRTTPLTDIMKRTEFKTFYHKELNNGLHTNFWFYQQNTYPSERFHFTKINEDGSLTEMSEITQSKLMFEFRYAPAQPVFDQPFYRRRLKGIRPTLSIFATGGIKGFLRSDYSFLHLKAHLKHNYPSPIGITRYQMSAGKIFGRVPFIEMEIHPGNTSLMRDDFRYLLAGDLEFASDVYASIWVDHLFNGTILNKIPLIKKLKLREGFTAKVLWGDISQQNRNFMVLPNQVFAPNRVYAEVGFNIYNIFKFIRLDYSYRLSESEIKADAVNGVFTPPRWKIMGSILVSL